MLKLFTTIFFTLFIFCIASAQFETIDSLKKVLPSLTGAARIDCLNHLCFEYSDIYWNKSNYVQTDTAFLYVNEALKEALELNYAIGIGQSYHNLGVINEQRGNFLKSGQYAAQAVLALKNAKDNPYYFLSVLLSGWSDYNEGKYKDALYNYHIVIPHYQQIKDSTHLAMIYRMTARAYLAMGYEDSSFALI